MRVQQQFVPLSSARAPSRLLVAAAMAVLAGCATPPSQTPRTPTDRTPAPGRDGPPPVSEIPPDLARVPDAEPRIETIRSGGPNKPYEVLGESYVPLPADAALTERGYASWYGRKFHGRRTASGETYNMYAMTAAHKTMPIPSYARVRNPANGREIVVRVNDRGPFAAGRVIDLSYTAALKLGVLGGIAPVEVERITPDDIRAGRWQRPGADATQLAAVTADDAAPAPVVAAAAAASPQGRTARPGAAAGTAAAASPAPIAPAVVAAADPAPADPLAAVSVAPPPVAAQTFAVASPPPGLVAEAPPAAPVRAYTPAAQGFWVQLGAFKVADGAQRFQQSVAQTVDWVAPLLAVYADQGVHRLQAGPYGTRAEARAAADRLRAQLQLEPMVLERR